MRWTIKHKLFGLTICSLIFVVGVSVTGYWGITTVEETTATVTATSSAIRNHIEAGVYNDLTRADVSAVFAEKGDEQQNKVEEFNQHCRLLRDRIDRARGLAADASSRGLLEEEDALVGQYVKAGQSLVADIVHRPSTAFSQLGPFLQLYKDLQGKIENTSDQLEKSSKEAEESATRKATRATRAMFGMCGMSLLLLLVVAVQITRSITQGLDSFSARFKAMADANDLTSRVDEDRTDEIGVLGRSVNLFVSTIHDIITQVTEDARMVARASEKISAVAVQSAATARSQSDQTHQAATAMQEMSSTVQEISENSQKAANTSRQAAEAARQGGVVVEATLASMQNIADATSKIGAKIAELGKGSEKIGKIVAVIDDIADQTNLLALNAAIEAARAGEQGRGFAVVADEVRKLAERTTKATQEIATMILSIQSETKNAVQAIAQGNLQVQIGVEKTSTSGTALKEIIKMSEHVGDMILQIATAATQQSATTVQINANVAQISITTEESTAAAEQTATSCSDLSSLASDLQTLVSQFKVQANGLEACSRSDRSAQSGPIVDGEPSAKRYTNFFASFQPSRFNKTRILRQP